MMKSPRTTTAAGSGPYSGLAELSRQATTVLDSGVFGHQRHRDDELVLDQLGRLQPPPFQFERLESRRRRLGHDLSIGHHDLYAVRQLLAERLETTLTHDIQRRLIVELQRQPSVAALSKMQCCSYTADVRMQQARKPRQLTDLELT